MAYQEALAKALKNQEKAEAFRLTRAYLDQGEEKLIHFYEAIIPNILNAIDCAEGDYECVFMEHRMSAVVRALVEMSHEYVIKHARTLTPSRTVLIACMREETHELGAVIGAHLFELLGFKTVFTGANTPYETIEAGIKALKADYLVLSATNAYHLLTVNRSIQQLKDAFPSIKVFGAGRGIRRNLKRLKLDGVIERTADIRRLMDEEELTCSPSA